VFFPITVELHLFGRLLSGLTGSAWSSGTHFLTLIVLQLFMAYIFPPILKYM